jgi:signal peptidase I
MFLEVSIGLLSQGYSVRFRPGGHSMRPTIRDGEPVTVEPIQASHVKRGDIILYLSARGLIAHRVIGIKERKNAARVFILRGDASTSSDERAEAGQVLGRVVSVERDGYRINLASRRAKLLRAARAIASRLKIKVLGMRDPQSEIKVSSPVLMEDL